MRILTVGDTHGNTRWLRQYIVPVALTLQAEAIVVVGDFGAWEHTPAGVRFFNDVDELAGAANIPFYWLHGNHDKWSHTVNTYERDNRGLYVCREWLFYIPQGMAWRWGGASWRSFGGAYSIDKAWRIQAEQEKYLSLLRKARFRQDATGTASVIMPQEQTLWFPEEEMTDAEMAELLAADGDRKDIVLSHDKPYSSRPGWNRKDLPGCVPNQLRLDRALKTHKPQYWFHGHLHYGYRSTVTGFDFETTVIGLDPDDNAAELNWKARQTFALVDCHHGKIVVTRGGDAFLDPEAMREHIATLSD